MQEKVVKRYEMTIMFLNTELIRRIHLNQLETEDLLIRGRGSKISSLLLLKSCHYPWFTLDISKSLPVSQFVPVYPSLQVHVYLLTWSVQVAPFLQGELEHSFISANGRNS